MSTSIKKKINWALHRHPLLYYIRFILISKNNNQSCVNNVGCFNDINDKKDTPKLFFDINKKIIFTENQDEFDKAITIAIFLRKNLKGGPGLGLSSKTTLKKMLDNKGGVCSDFSNIFCNFCLINDIRVKEWGCVERFYNSQFGHSFNEIYSTKFNKWIAIDISKGIYFNNDKSEDPLSTIELFQYLRSGNPLKYTFFSDYIPEQIDRLTQVYSKSTIPFIINNYKNNVNDYFLKKFENKFPLFVTNGLLILLRKNHQFIFVIDDYKKKLLPHFF